MTRLVPTELLPVAGLLALVIAWPRLRAPTSSRRLFAEIFGVTIGAMALAAAFWAFYWYLEQRW
jgi:hypothetical protein